ncbi:MAG: DUF362 domain-containing protein [bacterium]|nr:DUF362 domain-containing protein [bacterium]
MGQHTRRNFLKGAAVAGGAVALGGAAAEAQAAGSPMAIARWQGDPVAEDKVNAMAARLTKEAVDALGGMARFVKQGDVVCVKPNMSWDRTPEQAANTNPAVVATIITMCLEAGAKGVKVGDNTCHNEKKAYGSSGIADAARDAGADVFYVDKGRFRQVQVGGKLLDTMGVYPEMVDCDLVINAPVCKHHKSTRVTLAMKNLMGVVDDRRRFHQDLSTSITDITRFLKPRISVLDATRILTGQGPTGGDMADVKRMDTVAASTDIVALDAFGCTLLGHKPEEIGTVVAGHKAGLGEIDYQKLAKEIAVS